MKIQDRNPFIPPPTIYLLVIEWGYAKTLLNGGTFNYDILLWLWDSLIAFIVVIVVARIFSGRNGNELLGSLGFYTLFLLPFAFIYDISLSISWIGTWQSFLTSATRVILSAILYVPLSLVGQWYLNYVHESKRAIEREITREALHTIMKESDDKTPD
jgi:hypothetical protein